MIDKKQNDTLDINICNIGESQGGIKLNYIQIQLLKYTILNI